MTTYAQWNRIPVKVDIYNGDIWGFSNKRFWTNNTGSNVVVYYTLSCTGGDFGSSSCFKIGVNENWTATVWSGSTNSGTLTVPNGSSVDVNDYYAEGNLYLYYYY